MPPNSLLKPLTGTIAALRGGRRIVVLTYHRVLAEPDPLRSGDVTAADFESHVRTIGRYFNAMTFGDAAATLAGGGFPSNCVAITFDDGYRDNHDIALPILKKHGVPATFFVTTGFLDDDVMWNDVVIESVRARIGDSIDLGAIGGERETLETADDAAALLRKILPKIKRLPPDQRPQAVADLSRAAGYVRNARFMMTESEVRSMHQSGMEIGAHTVSHPILMNLEDDDAYREIEDSKRALEGITGEPVSSFAYPNGRPGKDFSDREVELVRRAGFRCAATTEWACATPDADAFRIPRVSLWGGGSSGTLFRLTRSFATRGAAA